MKVTQLREIKNAAATPFKGIESVHSIPLYNTESYQFCIQKRSSHKKSVKIEKNLIVKLRHSKAKETIKNLIVKYITRD